MGDFIASVSGKLSKRGIGFSDFYKPLSLAENRVMKEYGAIFLNSDLAALMPNRCIFSSEKEVSAFQGRVKISKKTVGGKAIQLQEAAMNALLKAQTEAGNNAKITPKGTNPARRSFSDVQGSWDSTVREQADYWTRTANSKGKKLTVDEAKELKSLTGEAQIKRVFELEAEGFSFHPTHDRSIVVYTAIPGASQHLLMLALDIVEFGNREIRNALAENGWFQTVYRDRPHFTYLGLKRNELQSLGLVMKEFESKEFWVPDMK
jgi:hypothetical protein